jgi:excinuclease UvrABC nuclease subunit
VTAEAYGQDVAHAEGFLRGETQQVLELLEARMLQHSEQLEFEQAAELRDQIAALSNVLHQQAVESVDDRDVDILAVKVQGGRACVNLAMVRGGRHLGDRAYFPVHVDDATALHDTEDETAEVTPVEVQVLEAFIAQHYVEVPAVPAEPTVMDRITGKAGQIEEARRRALQARQAALQHNKQERERLHAQAKRGRAVHPAMVERQADKYRAAIRAKDAADKALAEAQKQRQSAQNDLAEAKVARDQAKASEASVQRRLDQVVLDDAKALDQFSRHWNPAYVGALAKAAGVELVAGRGILDQLRRKGVATDVVDAARKVHEWDSRAIQEAHRWQDQQREIHRPKGG